MASSCLHWTKQMASRIWWWRFHINACTFAKSKTSHLCTAASDTTIHLHSRHLINENFYFFISAFHFSFHVVRCICYIPEPKLELVYPFFSLHLFSFHFFRFQNRRHFICMKAVCVTHRSSMFGVRAMVIWKQKHKNHLSIFFISISFSAEESFIYYMLPADSSLLHCFLFCFIDISIESMREEQASKISIVCLAILSSFLSPFLYEHEANEWRQI